MCIIHEAVQEGPAPPRPLAGPASSLAPRAGEATPLAPAALRMRSGACRRRRQEGVSGAAMAEGEGLVSVDYEVSGKVQGVFFRKYTQVRGVAWRGPAASPFLGGGLPAGGARCPLSVLLGWQWQLLWAPRWG